MEIEEILNCFNYPKEGFPSEAVNAALEQQEAITPHLLSVLEHTISNYESMDRDRMDYFFSLYLLSKFREKKALPLILAIASLPEDWPDTLLGDDIIESLPRFIVSTFDDDLSSIKKVIEDPALNKWSRDAALRSLLGLVAVQKLKREELVEYLRSLFHSPLAEDADFVSQLVNMACDLYPEELVEEINDAFKKDKVDFWFVSEECTRDALAMGKEKCLQRNVYNDSYHLPIDDVEKEMEWLNRFSNKLIEEEDEYSSTACVDCGHHHHPHSLPEIEESYVRPLPKIGRNDPCVCGSEKKYKKCCLLNPS